MVERNDGDDGDVGTGATDAGRPSSGSVSGENPATGPAASPVSAVPAAPGNPAQVPEPHPAGADDPDGTRVAGASLVGAAHGMSLALGFVVGLYGAFYSNLTLSGVPVGAIAGIVVNVAVCVGGGWALRTRLGSVLPAAGWLIAIMLLSSQRPEGDLIIAGTLGGYILIFGGTVATVAAVTVSQLAIGKAARIGRKSRQ